MTLDIKVSIAGVDAGTATDPNDFIMEGTKNTFKIIAEGTVLGTMAADPSVVEGTVQTVAHGQSITPFVMGFCKFNDGKAVMPGNISDNGDTTWFYNLKTDSTNIIFTGASVNAATVTFKYYITEVPL